MVGLVLGEGKGGDVGEEDVGGDNCWASVHEMAPIFPTILSSVGERRYFHFKEIIRGPRQRTKITDARIVQKS